MRILFIYSSRDALTGRRPLASLTEIHVGLSYISAWLKSRGHTTRLAMLSSETPKRSLAMVRSAITDFDPQLVAFTAVTTQYPFICEVARAIREGAPGKFLLLGGVHASVRPEEAIQGPFDAICIGEGEMATAELVDQLQAGKKPGGIANLWLKLADGSTERNAMRPFTPDLDRLPFPDREIWHEWVLAKHLTHQMVQPSRGCPYNCAYCSNHVLRRIAPGKYVRFRSPRGVVDEISYLKGRYPEMTDVYLQSETIAVDLEWLEELAELLHAYNDSLQQKISFGCNFRVARQLLTERLFAALERANVRTIEIGLESGSERLRAEVLRRTYSNEDFLEAVALARRHHMTVHVYNLIGIPGETPSEHLETVELNRRVCPDRCYTSIFYPYPGTDLYEHCRAQGFLDGTSRGTSERRRATLGYPTFSKAEIQRAFDWFEYRVYAGHRPLHIRVRKMLRNKMGSHPLAHLLCTRLLPLWYAVRGRQ